MLFHKRSLGCLVSFYCSGAIYMIYMETEGVRACVCVWGGAGGSSEYMHVCVCLFGGVEERE